MISTWLQARKALARALREPGRSQVWLSKLLGIGQPTISGWVAGRYRPCPEHRAAIEVLLGIPATAWATSVERARLRRVESFAAQS